MRPGIRSLLGLAWLFAVLVSLQVAHAHPDDVEGRKAEYVVDLSDRANGWLSVTATFYEVDRRDLQFREMGGGEEQIFEDVRFEGVDGPIQARKEKRIWELSGVPESGPLTIRYRVKPGGLGRHGHQGWVQSDWASFDGRILMLPRSRRSLRTFKLKLLTPDGWSTVHPFETQGEWLVMHDHRYVNEVVVPTCIATGEYDIRTWEYGQTELRVGAPKSWPQGHRDTLFQKSSAMFEWFHEELGFDRRGPFAVAWLPEGPEGKVFGGASVNGACYEHPEESSRNWLLLGHRIGHPMNKYTPAGLTIRDDRDHWFMEGWASYIEIVSAQRAGALPDQTHWNILWRRHRRDLARHPDWDVPLAEELSAADAYEYLHYTKGPLVVKQLDHLMRQRSGTDLEAFMKSIWAEHGFHASPFGLREEIERFTGDDYSDFWAVFVDQPGWPYPIWPEMIDDNLERRMADAPAAFVGDVPIHPEYLFWLAWSGEFERYADIEAFVVEAVHRQAVLEARGLELLPAEVKPMQFALPGSAQSAIGHTALAWDLAALPPQGGGCWGSPDPAAASIRYTDSPDGQVFARLLELEREFEGALGEMIGSVTARRPNSPTRKRPRLGVGPGEAFVINTHWVAAPPRAGFELWANGQKTMAKQLTMDPSWTNTHVSFDVGHRPADADVLLVKIGPDTKPVLALPLWQRQASWVRGRRASDSRKEEPDAEGGEADPAETESPDDQDPR